jgi:ABC-type glycerol-3-phosphate transport system permease component
MAATSMSIVPLIIVFLAFQKHFIKSMLTSGLSGK